VDHKQGNSVNRILKILLEVLVAVLLCAAALAEKDGKPASTSDKTLPEFVHAHGSDLVAGANSRKVVLRGVAFYTSTPSLPQDGDYEDVVAMHMNTVRLALPYRLFYDSAAPDTYKESAWRLLDAHVTLARKHRVWLILLLADVEGAQFVPVAGVPFDYRIWHDAPLQERFVRLWGAIAARYQQESQIAGYSLFAEPVVSRTVEDWATLANRALLEIRKTDRNHLVLVERIYGEHEVRREVSGEDLPPERAFFLLPDNNVAYEFYYFERDEFTHQFASWRPELRKPMRYPDPSFLIRYREVGGVSRSLALDKKYLAFYLHRQTEFGRKHKVPMFVWAFGAVRNCFESDKGGARWLKDVTDLFYAEKVNWTAWVYRNEEFGISENAAAKRVLADAAGR
jgi:hypothetical protein